MAAFKREIESEENVFRKQSSDSFSALRTSYRVAHLLAKESKPFSNEEFVRKYL
jgi:hypothetical protein